MKLLNVKKINLSMKPVVLITCYRRPEFLYHCLARIEKARYADKMLYLFALDFDSSEDNIEVINNFPFEKIVRMRGDVIRGLGKQSYNVMEGYREACELSDSFVFNIEDDIMVATNFFKWHLETYLRFDNIFCTIGTSNTNTKLEETDDLTVTLEGAKDDYQSWGVCFHKDILKNMILPLAVNSYYHNPNAYCIKNFPHSKFGSRWTEQDGLIRRIKEKSDMKVYFPGCPRAYHAGFYSYHRNTNKHFVGSLEDKIFRVGEILNDPEQYRIACESETYYQDSKPYKLDYAD